MIKKAGTDDLETLAKLAAMMWQNHSIHELIDEFSEIMTNGKSQCFLKYEHGLPIGFAQCQLRFDYVEGTRTSPVGYLEGIFVKEDYRNKGYGRELLSACEAWTKARGCHEFASDCEIENEKSFHFHQGHEFCRSQ